MGQAANHHLPLRSTDFQPVTSGKRIVWPRVIVVTAFHLLAALALLPALFSWAGAIAFVVGIFLVGMLGINLGYHRMLAHRSFTTPKWFEHVLAVLGICCLEGTPIHWIAVHRIHHQYPDKKEDPHTPLSGFLWAHFEWVLYEEPRQDWLTIYQKYAPDMIRDRFYRRLEVSSLWLVIYLLHGLAFFAFGFLWGMLLSTGSLAAGVQAGASLLVWGVFLRTVYVWHVTWSVNSFGHLFGYRNYDTADQSRNNWWVSILANGEGWHNNHHAHQRWAMAGHRWWEFDLTYQMIRCLELLGLADNVVTFGNRVSRVARKAR